MEGWELQSLVHSSSQATFTTEGWIKGGMDRWREGRGKVNKL